MRGSLLSQKLYLKSKYMCFSFLLIPQNQRTRHQPVVYLQGKKELLDEIPEMILQPHIYPFKLSLCAVAPLWEITSHLSSPPSCLQGPCNPADSPAICSRITVKENEHPGTTKHHFLCLFFLSLPHTDLINTLRCI